MQTVSPSIEVIPGRAFPGADPDGARVAAARHRRSLVVFLGLFLAAAAVGLSYTFARPAVYRSSATLLVEPPAVRSAENASRDADQAAAIERQALGEYALLAAVLARVADEPGAPATVSALEDLLGAARVEGTGMLELSARGADPQLVSRLVNAWIEVYLERQPAVRQGLADSADTGLGQQLQALERRIAEQREALERFRKVHDITSMAREENQALARLKGLNEALSKATQTLADAEARFEAIRTAAELGQPLVREQDRATLATLERQAGTLRAQVEALQREYTPQYIAINPPMAGAVRELEQLERQIQRLQQDGRQSVIAGAEQDLRAAHTAVARLEADIGAHKEAAARFTARFAEHDALQKDLEQLEQLYRDTRARRVQAEVDRQGQFPRVGVMARAYVPDAPIYPRYGRDAGFSLIGAALLGLLGALAHEWFARVRTRAPERLTQVYAFAAPFAAGLHPAPLREALPRAAPAPGQTLPRELSALEVRALLDAADEDTCALAMLLLAGVAVDEAVTLRWEDLAPGAVQVPGPGARTLPLPDALDAALARLAPGRAPSAPLWAEADGEPAEREALAARIVCAAFDAGLARPAEADADALRHSYLAFLVRQGVRLSELKRIAGPLPNALLAAYGALSPPMPGLTLERIDRVHPALRTLALPVA